MSEGVDARAADFARAVLALPDGGVVLASRSPRRLDLCRRLGLDVRVEPADIDEQLLPGEAPAVHVERLAHEKASAIVAGEDAALVIAADTIVVLDDDILGKPVDAEEAERMLGRLSGRTHAVYTGVAVRRGSEYRVGHERTGVTFREMTRDEIRAYVTSGEPLDKAGAYGAQALGAAFISRFDGCYYNVVGLPIARLVALVRALDGGAPRGDGDGGTR